MSIASKMLMIVAVSAFSAGAKAQQTPNLSFEAGLKQFCPTKNLEFLKPDVLARSTDGFVAGLPEEQRKQVEELAKQGVDACAGSADDSCRTAAVLGSIRYVNLSASLAQTVCETPYVCRDWFECSGEEDQAAGEAPTVRHGPETAQAAQQATPASQPHAKAITTPAPEPDIPTKDNTEGGALIGSAADKAEPNDAVTLVTRFYRALGRGDGIDAVRYMIPEKRGRGPYSAAAMIRFYGGLSRPLHLHSAQQIGPSIVRARYDFVSRDGSTCNGAAVLSIRNSNTGLHIEAIRALTGC